MYSISNSIKKCSNIYRIIIPFLLLFLAFSPMRIAQAQEIKQIEKENPLSTSDIFFQAHLKLNNADNAILEKDYKSAWENYHSALKYYQTLQLTHPLWKPAVITYRIDFTTKKLQEIKPELDTILRQDKEATDGIYSNSDTLKTDINNLGIPPELLKIQNKIDLLYSDLEKNTSRYEADRKKLTSQLKSENTKLQEWSKSNNSNPERIDKLKKEILRTEALIQNSKHFQQNDQTRIQQHLSKLKNDLKKQIALPIKVDLEFTQSELDKRNDELRIVSMALVKTEQQSKQHKRKLEELSSKLEESNSEINKLQNIINGQSKTSAKIVASLHAQLDKSRANEKKLKNDLNEAKTMLAELSQRFDQQFLENKELRNQLDSVTEERDRMKNLLLEDTNQRIKSLAGQNIELMQQLRDSQETLARVSKDQNDNLDRVQQAETDFAIAKRRLIEYQDRHISDAKKIKELHANIRSISQNSNNKLQSGQLSEVEREENLILRETAKKYQLREKHFQTKLQLLKDHVINQNDPIAIALAQNMLTEKALDITEKEKMLIDKKQKADATFNRTSSTSIEHAKTTLAQSQQEVEAIYRVVNRMLKRKSYRAAKENLLVANDILPNQFPTLIGLGTVSMKMNHFNAAENHFKDGIIMKRNNPFVHFQLGLCQFRKNQEELAAKSLKHSLELDPTLDKAAYYLGVIAGKANKLEEAQTYFDRAIRINPDFNEAYFAKSINFSIKGDKLKAQEFYQKALEKGYPADLNHAKKIKLN